MKKNVDYGKLAEELFSELEVVPLAHKSGGPQSTLGGAGVSGLSGHSK